MNRLQAPGLALATTFAAPWLALLFLLIVYGWSGIVPWLLGAPIWLLISGTGAVVFLIRQLRNQTSVASPDGALGLLNCLATGGYTILVLLLAVAAATGLGGPPS